MKTKYVNYCGECPYYNGHVSQGDPPYCSHTSAPEGYDGAVNPAWQCKPEVPKWCPISNGHIKVQRDSNDNIVSETKLVLTGKIKL